MPLMNLRISTFGTKQPCDETIAVRRDLRHRLANWVRSSRCGHNQTAGDGQTLLCGESSLHKIFDNPRLD